MPGLIFSFGDLTPQIHPDAFIADNAVIVGNVTVGAGASVWYGCVLRSEREPIVIGEHTSVQDGTVMHVDPGMPCTVGKGVTIGHAAVVHGATVGDGCLIGLHATVLSGSLIGEQAMIAAGALVKEGQEIPPGSLAAGVPAKVLREVSDADRARMKFSAAHYVELGRQHATNRVRLP